MQPKIRLDSFDAIIFDLGGVLLELHPQESVEKLTTLLGGDASALYSRLRQVALFDELERGEISEARFREAVRTLSQRDETFSDAQLDEAWNAMLGPIPAEHIEFLAALKEEKRSFVLSNTNVIHVRRFLSDYERMHGETRGSFESHFEAVHYSHDLKMRKPEARIFRALIEQHALNPSRTVFIDDNPDNVAAAGSLGLIGVLHESNSPLVERFEATTS